MYIFRFQYIQLTYGLEIRFKVSEIILKSKKIDNIFLFYTL